MSHDPGAQAQFSRPSSIGPFGKLEAECKTHVDEATLALFDQKARAAGGRSILLRNMVYLLAHGKSFDALMAEAADRRMRMVFGEGLELAHEMQALHVRGEVRAA